SFTPDKTGAIGWPALRAGYFISIIAIWHYTGYWKNNPQGWLAILPLSSPGCTGAAGRQGLHWDF
ncbi:MAG TPA: hypothetical protein PLI41_07965, partial [Bacteroidales bacterium]|nr:hypothetical protein [Bacteroidales bacterium]